MRKAVLSMFILLSAICSKAQRNPMMDRSHPDIPDSGRCVIEGYVTSVPDGTIVNFWFDRNGDYLGEVADTIVGGKFCFERNVDKWARYFITLGDDKEELALRAQPDVTLKITGNTQYCASWNVDVCDPWVEELNEYNNYKRTHLLTYMALKDEEGDLINKFSRDFFLNASKEEKRKFSSQRDSVDNKLSSMAEEYVNAMYEFMKDRPYSNIYSQELWKIKEYVLEEGKQELITKACNLCAKVPFDEVKEYQDLFFRERALDVGDEMVDFTLFDRKGRKHHLTEFNGNGKYLLLEFCSKDSKRVRESRPNDVLNELYKKYSKNLDIVTVNCDFDDVWNNSKFPRDPWNEWNDHNNSTAVMMRYTVTFDYVFLSPEGKVLGFGKHDNLKDKAKQHFAINL